MVEQTHAHALGLTAVTDDQLRTLLRGLHRKTLPCPLSFTDLTGHGLQDVGSPLLNHLRGLSEEAVRAVLVAVLAERRMAAKEREVLLERLSNAIGDASH